MKKNKLVSLDYRRLYNSEFSQFFTRLVDDFDKSGLNLEEDESLKAILATLKSKIPVYDKALEQIKTKEESKALSKLDLLRDDAVQALHYSILPYKKTKKDDLQKAYHAISIVLEEYKGLKGEAYEQETKDIDILVSKLKGSDLAPHLASLKIDHFVDELEQANKEFKELFSQRSVQGFQKESYNIKELRAELGDLYKKFATYTLAMAEVKGNEFFTKALGVVNNSRKYFSDTMARRQPSSNKKNS